MQTCKRLSLHLSCMYCLIQCSIHMKIMVQWFFQELKGIIEFHLKAFYKFSIMTLGISRYISVGYTSSTMRRVGSMRQVLYIHTPNHKVAGVLKTEINRPIIIILLGYLYVLHVICGFGCLNQKYAVLVIACAPPPHKCLLVLHTRT